VLLASSAFADLFSFLPAPVSQGWAKRMFNATEIEHAIQALEREIDTEMSTVNVSALVNLQHERRADPFFPSLQSSSATSSTTGTSIACTTTFNPSEPR